MEQKIIEYFESLDNLMLNFIKREFENLKIKITVVVQNDNFQKINEVIKNQKMTYENLKEHIENFEFYKTHIVKYLLKNKDEFKKNFDKEDGVVSYIKKHFKEYLKNLEKQKKEVEKLLENKKRGKIFEKVRSKLNLDLKSLIEIEEEKFFVLISFFMTKNEEMDKFLKNIEKFEKYEKWKKKSLISAIVLNLFPIHGVGDVFSIPFWGLFLSINEIEKHLKGYKTWKNTIISKRKNK
jgi:hypothetical protein